MRGEPVRHAAGPAYAPHPAWLRTARRFASALLAHLRRPCLCLLLLAAICAAHADMMGGSAATQAAAATAHEIKAAFLFKFLGYAELPKQAGGKAGAPITVAVFNADDVAADLARISAGRSVGNRPVAVRQVSENDPLTDVQMLFIGGARLSSASRLLRTAQQRPILIVTEADGALDQGSMINFRMVDGKIRFEASLETAEKNGIRLSSRLLSVALNVQRTAQ